MEVIPGSRLTVLIAHDEHLVTAGLSCTLQQEPGIELLGGSGLPPESRPADVVIADYVEALRLAAAFRGRAGRTPRLMRPGPAGRRSPRAAGPAAPRRPPARPAGRVRARPWPRSPRWTC